MIGLQAKVVDIPMGLQDWPERQKDTKPVLVLKDIAQLPTRRRRYLHDHDNKALDTHPNT